MSIEGRGPSQIARILMRDHVEHPSCYLGKRGVRNHSRAWDKSRQYDWNASEVASILSKQEYMGHTVNFRTYKESYKEKERKNRAPEEWKIFENTHEAIIDPDTWKLAQKARQTVRRTDGTGVANPLTGLVFCADCGAKMYNHRKARAPEGGEIDPETHSSPYDCNEAISVPNRVCRIGSVDKIP